MGRRPRPFPEGAIERLEAVLKKARNVGQYKRMLAVWLRASLGLNNRQVARALGWRPDYVRKFHSRYFREGEAVFQGKGRGGDRRPNALPCASAQAILDDLVYLQRHHGLRLTLRTIRAELEAARGHPISRSSAYRIIQRHGLPSSQLSRDFRPTTLRRRAGALSPP